MPALTLERCETCKKYEDQCSCDSLELTPSQFQFVNSDKRFIYYNGGRGSGKSWSACLKIATMIEEGVILPGARIAVFGPTYPQLKKGCILTFDKILGDAGMILEKIDGNEPERRLINDIVAYFRNASNPEQTRSHEVQIVWLDEAAQMDASILTLTNASLRQFGNSARYQTLLTSTPRGRNWLWRDFINPDTRKYPPEKIDYFQTSTVEAYEYGIVRDDYIEELGYAPGTEMWRQEVLAEFVTWSGLVFEYNRAVHSAPEHFAKLPEFTAVYGGIDVGYGGRGKTTLHLSGITKENKIFTFKEHCQYRAVPQEWMRLVAEWTREYKVRRWYIDSAADQEFRAMRSSGLPVYQAMKASDAAGTAVRYINGKFREQSLFIDAVACPFLVAEIEAYQHKEEMSGDEVTFLDKVKPNQPDDNIDGWRYGLHPLAASGAGRTYGGLVELKIA